MPSGSTTPPFNYGVPLSYKKKKYSLGMSSYLFNSSIVLASGLYFREQRSTLYTVITAGVAVEVGNSTAGRAAMVKLGLAAGRAARVD